MNKHSPASGIQVETLCDYRAFLALEEEWNHLAENGLNSVFLRHEWFDSAWQWDKEHAQLHILVARQQGKLVGIAPLIISEEIKSKIKVRALRFLTVPDTQLADLLCEEKNIACVTEAFATTLVHRKKHWDVLVLEYVPTDSQCIAGLVTHLHQCKLYCHRESFGPNWSISLKTDWATYYQTRSRRLKKSNNLIANRLEKFGKIEIERMSSDLTAASLLNIIGPISRSSWKASTLTTLDQNGPFRFIQKLTEHALRRGWLSIWLLKIDGQAVAYEFQLVYQGHVHGLRSDYDEKSAEGLSPGSYLNFKMIQSLFDTDANQYYLGPGNNTYKLRWTDSGMPLDRITMYGPSIRGRALKFMENHLLPIARQAKVQWQRVKQKTRRTAQADSVQTQPDSNKTSTEE